MHFRIYKDKAKEYRWTLYARNGRIIADSSEGYKRKTAVSKAIARIILGISSARIIE